jgi:hypothetical protein
MLADSWDIPEAVAAIDLDSDVINLQHRRHIA